MNLGPFEIITILVVALVIFGPKNLPKLGKAMGETVKNVREGMEGEDEPAPEEARTSKEFKAPEAPVTSSEDAHFCIHCGAPLPADAEFCSKCGKPQTAAAKAAVAAETESEADATGEDEPSASDATEAAA